MAEEYKKTSTVLAVLDILLAVLIIGTSTTVIKTSFGKASLLFGFIMITITTVLRVMRKW